MSARDERGSSSSGEEGKREERRWMRERALEMDSHQECIGSEEWPFGGVGEELLLGRRWWSEEEVEEEGEPPWRWKFKSMVVVEEIGEAPPLR